MEHRRPQFFGERSDVGALAAATWQGESDFDLNPRNTPNYSRAGDLLSVDVGPFQINNVANADAGAGVFGTDTGPTGRFNGNPDANIGFGINYLEGLYQRFGDLAAGLYTGQYNPNRPKRQETYDRFKGTAGHFFSNPNCFKQPAPLKPKPSPSKGGGGGQGSLGDSISFWWIDVPAPDPVPVVTSIVSYDEI